MLKVAVTIIFIVLTTTAFAQDISPQLRTQLEALAKEKEEVLKDAKLGQLMTENAQMKWEKLQTKEQQLKAQIDAETKGTVATKNK